MTKVPSAQLQQHGFVSLDRSVVTEVFSVLVSGNRWENTSASQGTNEAGWEKNQLSSLA